jgi:hypothetical protein
VKFARAGAGCGLSARQQVIAAATAGAVECARLQQSCMARIGHSRAASRVAAPATAAPSSGSTSNADAKRLNIAGTRLLPAGRFGKPVPRRRQAQEAGADGSKKAKEKAAGARREKSSACGSRPHFCLLP